MELFGDSLVVFLSKKSWEYTVAGSPFVYFDKNLVHLFDEWKSEKPLDWKLGKYFTSECLHFRIQ